MLMKLSEVVGDNAKDQYQFSRPFSHLNGERGEKRSQKTILSEFKANLGRKFHLNSA